MIQTKDTVRLKQLGHDIGLELLKFAKGKEKICMFGLIKDKMDVDDLFFHLCYLHNTMSIGYNHVCFAFDDRDTKFEDIYDDYDMFLIVDGVRHAEKNDIKFSVVDKKTVKLTYYTTDIFDNGTNMELLVNYDEGIFDYVDISPTEWKRVIRKEYEHFL